MPPKRTNDVAKDSVRKTRFKECNPALKVVKPKPVRVRGFWTDQKELELLKEYARLFPPACKRGMHSKAWAKIINCVNGLTPDEPPLSYDTCRRAVDRLVESYKKNLSERLVGSDQNKNRTEAEMAVYKIIKQRALHEAAKKSGRPQEFIRQENDLEGEECRSVSIPTVKLLFYCN
ncbi:hypothetical protein CLU79DRAFT_715014 [Phycomyces nitens]|nr:hypothetical protein CLU79DRAFT_715014 [Phycomyces nitens]